MLNLARFLARWAALGHKLGAPDFEKAGLSPSFGSGFDSSWVRHIPLDITRYRGVFALV